MQVIHGIWAHGALCLWAEDPELPPTAGATGRAPALAVLAALGGSGQPDDPATAGGSLAYLAAVARFAAGLAERGRVLPVLAAEDGTLAARWRPVLGGADVQRARDLAAAMPPV